MSLSWTVSFSATYQKTLGQSEEFLWIYKRLHLDDLQFILLLDDNSTECLKEADLLLSRASDLHFICKCSQSLSPKSSKSHLQQWSQDGGETVWAVDNNTYCHGYCQCVEVKPCHNHIQPQMFWLIWCHFFLSHYGSIKTLKLTNMKGQYSEQIFFSNCLDVNWRAETDSFLNPFVQICIFSVFKCHGLFNVLWHRATFPDTSTELEINTNRQPNAEWVCSISCSGTNPALIRSHMMTVMRRYQLEIWSNNYWLTKSHLDATALINLWRGFSISRDYSFSAGVML